MAIDGLSRGIGIQRCFAKGMRRPAFPKDYQLTLQSVASLLGHRVRKGHETLEVTGLRIGKPEGFAEAGNQLGRDIPLPLDHLRKQSGIESAPLADSAVGEPRRPRALEL